MRGLAKAGIMRIGKLRIAFLVLLCVAVAYEWWHFRNASNSTRQTALLAHQNKPGFALLPASEIFNAANFFAGPRSRLESWEPTVADINDLESNLSQITALSSKDPDANRHIDNPNQYFRQYLAVMIDGKKTILVNAICTVAPGQDWRKHLAVAKDGGKCFWHAIFDPASQKFSDLNVNGVG